MHTLNLTNGQRWTMLKVMGAANELRSCESWERMSQIAKVARVFKREWSHDVEPPKDNGEWVQLEVNASQAAEVCAAIRPLVQKGKISMMALEEIEPVIVQLLEITRAEL